MTIGNNISKIKKILRIKDSQQREKAQIGEVKVLRIPAFLLPFFPRSFIRRILRKKAQQISSDWNKEATQTHFCGTQRDVFLLPGADLIPQRVKRWRFREYQLLARKIHTNGDRKIFSKKLKVTLLKEGEPEGGLWEDMIKNKEERQFQITRITNFFS